MSQFNSFDEKRHTAIYVRISTASQKTDRQQEELTSYAELNQLNFNRNLDVFIDVVSGFKDGPERPDKLYGYLYLGITVAAIKACHIGRPEPFTPHSRPKHKKMDKERKLYPAGFSQYIRDIAEIAVILCGKLK